MKLVLSLNSTAISKFCHHENSRCMQPQKLLLFAIDFQRLAGVTRGCPAWESQPPDAGLLLSSTGQSQEYLPRAAHFNPQCLRLCYKSIVSSAWMLRDLASRNSVVSLSIEKGTGSICRAHAHEKVSVRRETWAGQYIYAHGRMNRLMLELGNSSKCFQAFGKARGTTTLSVLGVVLEISDLLPSVSTELPSNF